MSGMVIEGTDTEWQGDHDLFTDPEEQRHLFSVLDSFWQYRRAAHLNVTHCRRQNFYALPAYQRSILSQPPFSILNVFSRVDDAIAKNADLAEAILESGLASIGLASQYSSERHAQPWAKTATNVDLDKARSTVHQIYRDWSAEGVIERSACYGPILKDLASRFPPEIRVGPEPIRVLVPGAGLGRLVYEICHMGFEAEGNEISYHQLLTSSFILNHTTRTEEWALYPWAFTFSNNLSRDAQLTKVLIPDVHPQHTPSGKSMSMTTGDFCVVYRGTEHADSFDAVATVFFIDTAPNLINYIETVKHCLKPGGIWANLGPLLWHFSDQKPGHSKPDDAQVMMTADTASQGSLGIGEPGAFELCEDEVIALLQKYGFSIQIHETEASCTGYVQNPKSMLRNMYYPSHWIAIKL